MRVTQFNMKWVEQAGLVKFDFLGLKTLTVLQDGGRPDRAARHRDRLVGDAARRPQDLRDARRAARRSACSRWNRPACARRSSRCGPTVSRTSSRSSRSIGRARWPTSRSIARASSARTSSNETYLHPEARADAARDLRRHRLPGAGDAGRAGPRPATRSARPTFCAAPWARRSRRRWTRSATASSPAPSSGGLDKAKADEIFDLLRQVRRLRLQQEPRGGLRARRLPDRLSEGELSRSSSWPRR